MPAENGTVHLPAVIAAHFGRSRSDARRTLAQGGVRLDGEVRARRSTCPRRRSTAASCSSASGISGACA